MTENAPTESPVLPFDDLAEIARLKGKDRVEQSQDAVQPTEKSATANELLNRFSAAIKVDEKTNKSPFQEDPTVVIKLLGDIRQERAAGNITEDEAEDVTEYMLLAALIDGRNANIRIGELAKKVSTGEERSTFFEQKLSLVRKELNEALNVTDGLKPHVAALKALAGNMKY